MSQALLCGGCGAPIKQFGVACIFCDVITLAESGDGEIVFVAPVEKIRTALQERYAPRTSVFVGDWPVEMLQKVEYICNLPVSETPIAIMHLKQGRHQLLAGELKSLFDTDSTTHKRMMRSQLPEFFGLKKLGLIKPSSGEDLEQVECPPTYVVIGQQGLYVGIDLDEPRVEHLPWKEFLETRVIPVPDKEHQLQLGHRLHISSLNPRFSLEPTNLSQAELEDVLETVQDIASSRARTQAPPVPQEPKGLSKVAWVSLPFGALLMLAGIGTATGAVFFLGLCALGPTGYSMYLNRKDQEAYRALLRARGKAGASV